MTLNTTSQPTEQPAHPPSLRDMVMLELPYQVRISPGGKRVAVLVRTTNWKDNRYETVCTVHDLEAGTAHRLNRSGSVTQAEWVDDETLAVRKSEQGDYDPCQIVLYEGLMGEGWAVTDHEKGVTWLAPFAGGVLFQAIDPERAKKKKRTGRFGSYTHFEQEESASALYYVGIEEMRRYKDELRAATEEEAEKLVTPLVELSRLLPERLAILSIVPAPTGDAVYLNCQSREDLVYWRDTSSYRLAFDAPAALAEYMRREQAKKAGEKEDGGEADDPKGDKPGPEQDVSFLGTITRLNLPRLALIAAVSPDGQELLVSYPERDDKMYTQADLWRVDLDAALAAPDAPSLLPAMHNLTGALDRSLLYWRWTEAGLFASYADGTRLHLARVPLDGRPERVDLQDLFLLEIEQSFDVSAAGRVAFIGINATTFREAYTLDAGGKPGGRVRRLTAYGQAVEGWALGSVETIRWHSKDGTEIEGVLRKPANFDPGKRYALVFVVHGGPTWFSSDSLLSGEDVRYYPAVQLVNEDVLVLKPNYRGSMGRGQAFLDLNVNNLGVGDLWDLESAIDHLVELGWVDPERVGCMGWSQGGYISAFAGLWSDRFRAVSVGAGISDWYTYHISNDIPDFTVDYLSGSPFQDRARYLETAPIANLAHAHTPMLIQHGAEDRRVPLSNATELYRGLKEMGVPVELFVFPGMGHPIVKPRENHAVMHQNLAWFRHYLLGAELNLE